MRASLLVVPLLLISCGGGSSNTTGTTKPKGDQVAGKDTRGFDEYPTDYGADEYGEFGYDDGYYGGEYGGYGYGGYGYDGGGYYDEPYVPPPPTPPEISGTFTRGCDAGDKDSKKLTFVNTASRWDLTIESYADTTCTKRTTATHVGGGYTFVAQSTTLANNAWNGVFSFDVREVTADDAKTAKALGKTCGIKKMKAGKAVSLLEKGCAKLGFKPLADCASDFDVVAIEGVTLKFGDRPADNDLCTEAKRPTALAAKGFPYQWPPTGVPECDAYQNDISKMFTCPAVAQYMTYDMLGQYKQMMQYYKDAASCKAASDATNDALKAYGC